MRAEASRYKTFRWISVVDDIAVPQTRCVRALMFRYAGGTTACEPGKRPEFETEKGIQGVAVRRRHSRNLRARQ
jgi:hypothetical protein